METIEFERSGVSFCLDPARACAGGIFLKIKGNALKPGRAAKILLDVPSYETACYYAPFQKYAIFPEMDLWPEGYNQGHPLWIHDFQNLKRGGFFLLLKLTGGDYLALLPLVGQESMAWFEASNGQLELVIGHWGKGVLNGTYPALSWARDDNVYAAVHRAWAQAADKGELAASCARFQLREAKRYPEPFEYLGWCSYEEYKDDIDERRITGVIHAIDASNLPINWVLIDAGHVDQGQGEKANATPEASAISYYDNWRLQSFGTDAERFPNGWEPVMRASQQSDKIKWMGIWLNFNGYWGGIWENNALPESVRSALWKMGEARAMPKPDAASARAFYDCFIGTQAEAGFDFLKVDNRAANISFYRDRVDNAVSAANYNNAALENAVREHALPLISCMSHNNISVFNYAHGEIARCSEDYAKEDAWRAKHHLSNSFGNALWMGQSVWCDHDMFHATDRVAGEIMARSKAIAAGPVYLSDPIEKIDLAAIQPLCTSEGRILRTMAPAVPLPESIFLDTYQSRNAFRVIAPLQHGCAAVALYNLTAPGKPVRGVLLTEDYTHAAAMLPEDGFTWALPEEGLVVYDWISRKVYLLDEAGMTCELPELSDRFYIMSPVRYGLALIGDPAKYLAPEMLTDCLIEPDRVSGCVREACRILFWCRQPEASFTGIDCKKVSDDTWEIMLGKGSFVLERALSV